MALPKLTVTAEPSRRHGGAPADTTAHYLPVGATTSNGQPENEVVLQLAIQNNETIQIEVTDITFSFPQSRIPVSMKNLGTYPMFIPAGGTLVWANGFVDGSTGRLPNQVFLNFKPTKVTVSIRCKDTSTGVKFSEPYTVTWSLAPHKSPTPSGPTSTGSYLFPYSINDLRDMEYFTAKGLHYFNGGISGSQVYALDFYVVGLDTHSQIWAGTMNGDISKKEDYRIWNNPIRAMADGVVRGLRDFMIDTDIIIGNDGQPQFPPKPSPDPGTWWFGNFIRIETSLVNQPLFPAEQVLYCHLKEGSIPNGLRTDGARVNAGDIIGYVGKSGQSRVPHTHIECATPLPHGGLRPFTFHNAWIVDYNKLISTNTDGMWVQLQDQGIPKETVAIWPSSAKPYTDPLSGP